MPTAADIVNARNLFKQEVVALCAASQNAGLSPELLAAYTFLRFTGWENVWSLYADKGAISARLQYLYATRHVYKVLLGAVGLDVDYGEAGVEESLSDESKNFLASYGAADDEITLLETQARANVAPAIGRIETCGPYVPGAPVGRGPWGGGPSGRGPWGGW